jgi:hypothetical protein
MVSASLQSGADFRNVFASSFGDDAPALTMLQHCRRAMGAQGRLLVIECVLPADPTLTPSTCIDVMRRVVSGLATTRRCAGPPRSPGWATAG